MEKFVPQRTHALSAGCDQAQTAQDLQDAVTEKYEEK